nr:RNA-directed DNA polymerase [Dietzia sp. CW19]
MRLPVDAKRVFSYRLTTTDDRIFAEGGWRQFQEQCRNLSEDHKYVVSVDIADFYSRIYHHRIENALRVADPDGVRTKQIMAILGNLSNGTSYGLPVGGAAARVLAELVLSRTDLLLARNPSIGEFCRYVDDYRFFVDDLESAYQTIGFLSEKLLRNEGLSLQKNKTRVQKSAEYLSTLDPADPIPGSAEAFLGIQINYDPYSDTAEHDFETTKEQIAKFDVLSLLHAEFNKDRIHTATTKRLVQAVKFMDKAPRITAIESMIENIGNLWPVVPQVLIATRSALENFQDDSAVERIHESIRGLIQNRHHSAQVDLNLQYMIRTLATRHSVENEELLVSLFNSAHGYAGSPSPTIQRDIILIMANWGATYWLSDQKNYYAGYRPWVKRAFLISSYRLGDEGDHWRRPTVRKLPKPELIFRDWFSGRVSRPNWDVPL